MERINWDQYFIKMAELAKERSSCLSRQVGAVIVKDKHVIATGYNGATKGSKHCDEKGGCIRKQMSIPSGERLDICSAVHAEQNAIIQAAYTGVSTKDATMYVTVSPCFTCAKMIVNAGITKVITAGDYPDDRTKELFKEVGVTIEKI